MTISLQVNGKSHEVDADPSTPLLYVLRNDLGLHGAKIRMRPRAMRRLHGPYRRTRCLFLRPADRRCRRGASDDAGRLCSMMESQTRFSRRLSTNRPRNAATAFPA